MLPNAHHLDVVVTRLGHVFDKSTAVKKGAGLIWVLDSLRLNNPET